MAITYAGAGAEATGLAGANPQIPYPAVMVGEFLWVPVSASVTTVPAANAMAAAGFTRRYGINSGGGSPVGGGYYKFATGSETGTATFISPGGLSHGRMFVYRGVDPNNPFDVPDVFAGYSTSVTAYEVPAQTTTMPGATPLLHTFSNATSGTWTQPTFYTELMDSTAGGTVNATSFAHRLAWAGSGDTGIRTVTRSAGSRGGAAGVVLRPAGTGTTGTSAATLPALASASAGTVATGGTSAVILPKLAAAAVATLAASGTSAPVLPALQSASAATVGTTGTSAATLPLLVVQGVLSIPISGAVTSTLPRLESFAVASVFLDKSQWRNVSVVVGAPYARTLTAGAPTGNPMQVGTPRSEP